MVVVDPSALIPLARVGRLDLVKECWDDVISTQQAYRETVGQGKGKSGTSQLKEAFDEWIQVEEVGGEIREVAELEGIQRADAAVIILAEQEAETLLANDKALIEVARSRGVECYWLTTLLLKAIKDNLIDQEEGKGILYNLVGSGMNLKPAVYTRVREEIEEL